MWGGHVPGERHAEQLFSRSAIVTWVPEARVFVDTHDTRSNTFPAGMSKQHPSSAPHAVVFRALRSLAQRKLIETGRMRICVLDCAGLARLAAADAPHTRSR